MRSRISEVTPDPAYIGAVFGHPTAAAGVPTVGQGTYAIEMLGALGNFGLYGTGAFNLDFDEGRFEYIISNVMDNQGQTFTGNFLNGDGALGTDGAFNGQVNDYYGVPGTIDGHLFGSNGGELGATYLSDPDAPFNYAGVILGRSDSNVAPYNFQIRNLKYDEQFRTIATAGVRYTLNGETGVIVATPSQLAVTAYMTYDAGDKSWTAMTAPAHGPFTEAGRTLSADGAYDVYASDPNEVLRVYRPGTGMLNLTYASFATIEAITHDVMANTSAHTMTFIPWGFETNTLPRSGSATYGGVVVGQAVSSEHIYDVGGTFNILAAFGTGDISGSFALNGKDRASGTGVDFGTIGILAAAIDRHGYYDFIGSMESSASFNESAITGTFFGPAAQEIGGAFVDVQRPDPLSPGVNVNIGGAFVGKN